MVVCKRSSNGNGGPRHAASEAVDVTTRVASRLGEGGPVFLPRRKPSAIAETLLAYAAEADPVTAYDDIWFAGRPSS